MPSYEPLTREYRGNLAEPDLTHFGYISVVDEHSNVLYHVGNPDEMIFYRSSSKPIQALPVIARHLDEQYGLTEEETVLFSGSHAGESFHIDALKSIMKKADLTEDMLIMKPAVPAYAPANEERIRQGLPPSKLYHNCSGKHAALMLTQRALGGNVRDYWKTDAVVNDEIMRVISIMSEFPKENIQLGIDGCGVPVFAVGMKNIAIAYKNLACIDTISDDTIMDAASRYVPRIHKYNRMMRGTGYLCSRINEDPNIIAKGGANGVYGLGLKKERIGISFKLADGTEDSWPIIIKEIFRIIGYQRPETLQILDEINNGVVLNSNDTPVGWLRPVFTF